MAKRKLVKKSVVRKPKDLSQFITPKAMAQNLRILASAIGKAHKSVRVKGALKITIYDPRQQ